MIVYLIIAILVLCGTIAVLWFLRTRLREDLHAVRTDLAKANAGKAAAQKRAKLIEQRCVALVANMQTSLTNTSDALAVARGVEQLVALVTDAELDEPPRHAIGQYHHPYEHPYPLPTEEVPSNGQHGRDL